MAKQTTTTSKMKTPKKKRKGVHKKSVNSKLKKSKNYTKNYVGQGR